MTVVSDFLRDAQALLGKGRSEYHEATDGNDEPVDPVHDDATKFSVWGALRRAAYDRRDSTGFDTALVYLGFNNTQDPQLRGVNGLDDDKLNERFEEAIRLAEGGERKEKTPLQILREQREAQEKKRQEREEQQGEERGVSKSAGQVPAKSGKKSEKSEKGGHHD